ncbi:MAG TPA: tRNA-uridine aminocarboxypropyltransferase [Myxococcales bacterium]|jgi:DTW domain-containing protein YfiP
MTEPRQTCPRCLRPTCVCYCAQLPSVRTRTRVVLLQHPRESRVPIGTARMASLCLTGSQFFVGLDFSADARLQASLADPACPAALLFPGEDAVDLAAKPPAGPITLVVVDGTWSQAKKLLTLNPAIAALPRYALDAAGSEYGLRRAPQADHISTLEAVAHALGILEGPETREALLVPLRRMVSMQHEHKARLNGGLERHKQRWQERPEKAPRIPVELTERQADLVCVAGEVNAWNAKLPGAFPTELVHWAACRPATGERFEAVLAHRHPLAPSTPFHTGLSVEELERGVSLDEFAQRWTAFLREGDVLCSWGTFAADLARDAAFPLPGTRLDLRKITGDLLRVSPGSVEDATQRWGVTAERLGAGRAGERLGHLVAVARHLGSLRRRQ